MTKLVADFKYGTLSAGIGSTDTTITSAEFADLPVVSSPDTMDLVLNPGEVGGDAEIVTVTAHTSASTSVTVAARTGSAHGSGTQWVHAVTAADFNRMGFDGNLEGNADTATALETARTIGGVSFDGTANINLPGVNTAGNQDTSGNAATATTATNLSGGSVAATTGSFTGDVDIANATPVLTIKDDNSTGTSNFQLRFTDTADTTLSRIYGGGGNDMRFEVAGNDVFFISDSQRIGINDTSPGYTLDVNGTGRFTGELISDSYRWGGTGYLTSTTTSALESELLARDVFDSSFSAFKTGWSYAGNGDLTDAGRLTELAGTSWLTWTDNSADNTLGNYTALVIAPNTGGSGGGVFVYNDQGSSYSPGWRELWNSSRTIVGPDGSASAPAYSFADDTNTGMYSDGSNSISFSTAGTQRLDVDNGGIKGKVPFMAKFGTNAAPGYSFDGDTDTGMYRYGTNAIGWSLGGSLRLILDNNGSYGRFFGPGLRTGSAIIRGEATAASPVYTFYADENTGMYRVTADQVGFATAGTLRGRFWSQGLLMGSASTGNAQVGTGTGAQAAPVYGFYNDTDTGMYRGGTNILRFTTAGVWRGQFDANGYFYTTAFPGVSGYYTVRRRNSDGLFGYASSSQRYKENIVDADDTWRQVYNLRPRDFDWRESMFDGDPNGVPDDRSDFGLIAEEAHEVMPSIVQWSSPPPATPDDVDGAEEAEAFVPQIEAIDYEKLATYLLPAVQDLNARLAALEAG